jgi:hypothetical protein
MSKIARSSFCPDENEFDRDGSRCPWQNNFGCAVSALIVRKWELHNLFCVATSVRLFYENVFCCHTNPMPPPRRGGEGDFFCLNILIRRGGPEYSPLRHFQLSVINSDY